MDLLLKQIEENKDNLYNKLNEPNEENEFFEEFSSSLSLNVIDNLTKLDVLDFVKAYLLVYSKNKSYEDITAVIEEISPFFEHKLKSISFFKLVEDILELKDKVSKDDLIKLINGKSKKLLNSDDEKRVLMIKKIQKLENTKLQKFIELCYEDTETVGETCSLLITMYNVRHVRQRFEAEEIRLNGMTSKEKELFKELVKNAEKDLFEFKFKSKDIEESIDGIRRYASDVISEEKARKRKIKKNFSNYTYIESWIKRIKQNQEITTIPDEVMQLDDEELQKQILERIYSNNMSIYTQIEKKYNDLSSNSYNKYSLLLEQYGIDISNYNIDITNDINEVEKILKLVSSLNIKSPHKIVEIINTSKLEIVESINNLVKKGYIDNEYVNNNINIFSDSYIDLISNIEEFKKEGLSLSSISKLKDSLCEDSDTIQRNIAVLKEYGLFSSLGDCSSSSFLNNEQLEKKIDKLLELGIEQFLREDLSLLNYEDSVYDKILLAYKLNIPIEDTNSLHNILSTPFIVSDDDIDTYLFNVSRKSLDSLEDININKDDLLELLEKKQSSENVYDFDGVLISKNKVSRNLENSDDEIPLKTVLLCMIDDKILDTDELEKITKSLYPKEKQYKK